MKKLAGIAIVVALAAATGIAQNPDGCTAARTAQERFVQREIQERIDESIEAAEAKDLAARIHYFSPNLTLKLVDGTVIDHKQLDGDMQRDSDWILSISDQTVATIDCLKLTGRQAVLLANQRFVRTIRTVKMAVRMS